MAKCIALDIDCAEICALAASVMGRASETSKQVCSACAQVCQMCGDECAKHQMQHCQDCAQACMRCADECRKMAEMACSLQDIEPSAPEIKTTLLQHMSVGEPSSGARACFWLFKQESTEA
jgi:hypothetical protein